MSMTRSEAIKHFGLRSKSTKTAIEHLASAPESVRNGLHPQDLAWIKRFGQVPAVEAARRLAIRSAANPDGLPTKPGRPSEGKTKRMEVRLTPAQKAKVNERGGSAWVLALIDAAP